MSYNQLRLYVIATLGLVGVVSITLLTGGIDVETKRPNPITVNGQTITFNHTDKIAGEDLIIFTDQATYTNGISHAEVYVAVANISDVAQNVELAAYFRDSQKRIRNVWVLSEVTQEYNDAITETNCSDVITYNEGVPSSTPVCIETQTGTTTRQETKAVWAPLPIAARDVAEVAKEEGWLAGKTREQVAGFLAEAKSVSFPVRRGEVVYYKVLVEFPANQTDEFFFEAIGSEGGYGFLR